jgi:hypothetical protein
VLSLRTEGLKDRLCTNRVMAFGSEGGVWVRVGRVRSCVRICVFMSIWMLFISGASLSQCVLSLRGFLCVYFLPF